MKLSEKQKEVIRLMREGYSFSIYGCNGVVIPYSEQQELVKWGVVTNTNPFMYELTTLGKTVEL